MQVNETSIQDVKILIPQVFGDERGFFLESYNEKVMEEILGIKARFVQDNHSRSVQGAIRGLHYQMQQPQGKLLRVVAGEVYDVVVDLRKSSKTFGKWFGTILSAANKQMLWVPVGFAHGFQVLSEYADFLYKTTDYYHPASERCLRWDDPDLNIPWPIQDPILSAKDRDGNLLKGTDLYP